MHIRIGQSVRIKPNAIGKGLLIESGFISGRGHESGTWVLTSFKDNKSHILHLRDFVKYYDDLSPPEVVVLQVFKVGSHYFGLTPMYQLVEVIDATRVR